MMNFVQKLKNAPAEGVTVAFLGDSVTYGAFELYRTECGEIGEIDDPENGYANRFLNTLRCLYPNASVTGVNAGISGDHARNGAKRVAQDVIRHKPDLTVVCYGLNDCGDKAIYAERYVNALRSIFGQLRACGSEIVFMTPNMMNTKVDENFAFPELLDLARGTMQRQNEGIFDAHLDAAKALCAEMNVPVCDCYALWKRFAAGGVDTTALLCNRINHPSREMHGMFAYELTKTVLCAEGAVKNEP